MKLDDRIVTLCDHVMIEYEAYDHIVKLNNHVNLCVHMVNVRCLITY